MKPRKQKNKQSRRPDVKRRPDSNSTNRVQKKQQSSKQSTTNGVKKQPKKSTTNNQRHTANSIPFEPKDRILLVGEGDFSYSHSVLTNSLVAGGKLLCTSYDSEEQCYEKYPHAKNIVTSLKEGGHTVLFDVDITAEKKLPKVVRKAKGKGGFDAVIFNFPHTGGLTTDVSRQIRANQELLLGFFKTVKPLLSRPEEKKKFVAPMALSFKDKGKEEDEKHGSIAVTLFDGKPYEDWNIKEMARSCGLKTRRAFRFDAGLFEGYKHALTIGHRGRGDKGEGSLGDENRKNENKPARTYVFEDDNAAPAASGAKGKKRKMEDSSDSE